MSLGKAIAIVSITLLAASCSLFQPAAPVQPVAPPANVQQVAANVVKCMTQQLAPCMTQPPPLNNPQLCLALAGTTCLQAN